MLLAEHPEVVAPDWVPPVLVGRSAELETLRQCLPVRPDGPATTEVAFVRGPPGSGSSTVARRAAWDVVERVRLAGAAAPLYAPVRVRWTSGPQGIAAELIHRIDPEFRARGFSAAQLLAGFLRRLLHGRRSAVVVLDDLGADCPDISLAVRALMDPDRFLPEGASERPRIWLLLAGSDDVDACWRKARSAGVPDRDPIVLAPYSRPEVLAIVRDRARRALGREVPAGWAERIAEHGMAHGIGARRAIELLRREILGSAASERWSPYAPPSEAARLAVEPRLLEALERAASEGRPYVHDVREWEARLAREEGVRPLPSTTLWRRIVRLEAAGVVRREVRTGGSGGTRSRLEIVRPSPGPASFTAPRGTPRGSGVSFGP